MALNKDGKPRKKHTHTKLGMKNRGKPGAVSVGSNFTAEERERWHETLEFVRENYAVHIRANRKREDCAMILLEAAMTQMGLVVQAPHVEAANDAAEDYDFEVTGEEVIAPLGAQEERDFDSLSEEEQEAIADAIDEDEHSVIHDETTDDDCEILPLSEVG